MDLSKVKDGLGKLLQTVQVLAPIARTFGGPMVDKVSAIITTGVTIASNVLERVEEGAVVAETRDVDVIKAILSDLQAENDELAKAIDAS